MRSLKVVIGDPITLPVVNATNRIIRLFDGTIVKPFLESHISTPVLDPCRLSCVFESYPSANHHRSRGSAKVQPDHSSPRGVDAVQDGGFLDLRSIYMIRGGGYPLDDGADSTPYASCWRLPPLLMYNLLSHKIQIDR